MKKTGLIGFGQLALMVAGILVIWAFLYVTRMGLETPLPFLLLGLSLCSVSLILGFVKTSTKASLYSLLSLYLLSYCLLTLYSFRYDVFYGADVIGEYMIASETVSSERWPVGLLTQGVGWLGGGRYANCLSVTVLPAFLQKVMGIDLILLFKYVLPGIGAFVPILLFLVIRAVFDSERLAFLAGALFSINHLNIFLLSYLFREQVAYFALFLSIYVVFKRTSTSARATMIGLFLVATIFSDAGHQVTDFGFIFLLGIAFLPNALRLFKKKVQPPLLSSKWLLYYAFLSISWIYFTARPLLMEHVEGLVRLFTNISIYVPIYLDRLFQRGVLVPTESQIAGGLGVSRIQSLWYYLNVGLALLAILYLIIRRNTQPRPLSWSMCSFLFGGLFIFTVVAPGFIPAMASAPVFLNPIFSSLIAVSLMAPLNLHLTRFQRYLKPMISAALILFLFASLPLNMSLIDHSRILHYHREDHIAVSARVLYHDTGIRDFQFARWLNLHASGNVISEDFRGFLVTYLAFHPNLAAQSYPTFSLGSNLLILHNFYLHDDLWVGWWGLYPREYVSSSSLIQNTSIVCSNGEMLLLCSDKG